MGTTSQTWGDGDFQHELDEETTRTPKILRQKLRFQAKLSSICKPVVYTQTATHERFVHKMVVAQCKFQLEDETDCQHPFSD
jgi:hypothetical protein